ncbi:hypothetical protein ACFO3U_03420 [Flavobacterium ponti]|uniref:Uncharacterized protein n=1 Tax=Flavobacterium ponti TaxID=665133 RepID=A0ABV9P3T4_9FLAO
MKNYITIMLFLVTSIVFSQDTNKEAEKEKTKIDAFYSKTGSIIKFTDYKITGIKSLYDGLTETRIRKIKSGTLVSYFFQIEKKGKYSNAVASIEYSDLLEIIKALSPLKSEIEKDIASNPEYLENKFTTVDGFKIGYYVSKGKATWYMKLEKYGSDNTIYIENIETIEKTFEEAKNKIEELKTK